MDDGKSAGGLQASLKMALTMGPRNRQVRGLWRESARLAADADKRDRSNEIGAYLLDEMLKDDN